VGDILGLIACVFNDVDVLLSPPAPIALIVLLRGWRKRDGERESTKNTQPINLESVLMWHVFPNMQHLF